MTRSKSRQQQPTQRFVYLVVLLFAFVPIAVGLLGPIIDTYSMRKPTRVTRAATAMAASAAKANKDQQAKDDTESKQPSKVIDNNGNSDKDLDLLLQWAGHCDASYHDFTNEEASMIRQALLKWYRANRRKLPWRGDLPPFSSATSIVKDDKKAATTTTTTTTTTRSRKKQKTSPTKGHQTNIQSFFGGNMGATGTTAEDNKTNPVSRKKRKGSSSKSEPKEAATNETGDALPVTGYGVWVSEIMLQQTRVEAVIPYYLKCTLVAQDPKLWAAPYRMHVRNTLYGCDRL